MKNQLAAIGFIALLLMGINYTRVLLPGDTEDVSSPDTIWVNETPVANRVTLRVPTRTPTVTPTPAVIVLCDGQAFDGYTSSITLNTADDYNPSIQKVIRNCTFRNSSQFAINVKYARNVLIEGNTFENIRTNIPGEGVHAINISCPPGAGCDAAHPVDNIVIRNNTFSMIGADGVQLGANTRYISNVTISGNTFIGAEGTGENGIDVKGVVGPVLILDNIVHGFRECKSPGRTGGTQDCSGSPGEGIVIHAGGSPTETIPVDVTLRNNEVYDNVFGIVVSSGSEDVTLEGNYIHDNIEHDLFVYNASRVYVKGLKP